MTEPLIQPTPDNLRDMSINSLNNANSNMADAVTEGANGQGANARVRIEAATAQALVSIATSLIRIGDSAHGVDSAIREHVDAEWNDSRGIPR